MQACDGALGGNSTCSTERRSSLGLCPGTALLCLVGSPAFAQVTDPQSSTQPAATSTGAATPDEDADASADQQGDDNNVLVTGSRIRQDPNNSALPLQIITNQEVQRN